MHLNYGKRENRREKERKREEIERERERKKERETERALKDTRRDDSLHRDSGIDCMIHINIYEIHTQRKRR